MAKRISRGLTDAELRIMRVLWQRPNASVADILGSFPRPRPAYTTIQTTLRVLEVKGHVGHKEEGRTYLYFARLEPEKARGSAVTQLLERFFGKSAGALALRLVEEEPLSDAELDRLERTIAKRRMERA